MVGGDVAREACVAAGRPVPRIVIVLLAAGKATRMGEGGPHKLLAQFDGVPLVRRSAQIAVDSGVGPVIIVTGHRHHSITGCLHGIAADIVSNPNYETGMASSIRVGLKAAHDKQADGLLVMLADMPALRPDDLKALSTAFSRTGGSAFVRAVSGPNPGHPVILPRAVFPAIDRLRGDVGARQVIETAGLAVVDVDLGEAACLDVDTVEAVRAAGGTLTT